MERAARRNIEMRARRAGRGAIVHWRRLEAVGVEAGFDGRINTRDSKEASRKLQNRSGKAPGWSVLGDKQRR